VLGGFTSPILEREHMTSNNLPVGTKVFVGNGWTVFRVVRQLDITCIVEPVNSFGHNRKCIHNEDLSRCKDRSVRH